MKIPEGSDRELLAFLHARLVNVYGESPMVDFLHRLRAIIGAIPARQRTAMMGVSCDQLGDWGEDRRVPQSDEPNYDWTKTALLAEIKRLRADHPNHYAQLDAQRELDVHLRSISEPLARMALGMIEDLRIRVTTLEQGKPDEKSNDQARR